MNDPIIEALLLAQIALNRWQELYADLSNNCGPIVERKLDYKLPPADHVRAMESITDAIDFIQHARTKHGS